MLFCNSLCPKVVLTEMTSLDTLLKLWSFSNTPPGLHSYFWFLPPDLTTFHIIQCIRFVLRSSACNVHFCVYNVSDGCVCHSTGAAVINGSPQPSSSSSINDVSSMSTEPTVASDTDSSLEASAGPLSCCRWLSPSPGVALCVAWYQI